MDFHAFEASEPRESISLLKVSSISNEKLPVEKRRRLDGLNLDLINERLEGAEWNTFGKPHTSTRTTVSGSTILAVSARALVNNRHP